ncbi:alpha/beta hydrolase, partial [Natronorubrum tibetense]|uniref:alpha/beta hydrolase n=1 Tax=Natronorubrum tibetense TaxID=63128 RepID=UPI00037FD75F
MDPLGSDITAPDGTRLRRWEVSSGDESEAVLFVHGATYPSRAVFAPPMDSESYSWLHATACRGRAAFAVDLRGYGESERPSPTDDESNALARATAVVGDVATVLESIRGRFDRVHLVGYSWGSIVCGSYLTTVDDDVASLTQVAPVYRPPAAVGERFVEREPLDTYRRITREDVRDRWNEQIPAESTPADWRGGGGGGGP